jgi:acyl carrier protein
MTETIRAAVVQSIEELTSCAAQDIADTDALVEDLGIDSMIAVSLFVAIETRLQRTLPEGSEALLMESRTIGELVENLAFALSEESGGEIAAPAMAVR